MNVLDYLYISQKLYDTQKCKYNMKDVYSFNKYIVKADCVHHCLYFLPVFGNQIAFVCDFTNESSRIKHASN